MYAKVYSATTSGIDGVEIIVEVDLARGLPCFEIVGLPNTSVKEARERVRAALKNTGLPFPLVRIIVNLAPADIRKNGSGLDLPIAIGILISNGVLPQAKAENRIFVGELSLEGVIRPVDGVLSMLIAARDKGFQEAFIPRANKTEGSLVKGIKVYAVETLAEVINYLQKGHPRAIPHADFKKLPPADYKVDFSDVKGQRAAKRALEIAAAGGHNILMEGVPGSGKTMLAKRLPTIFPPMTEQEALEVTKIYSITGKLRKNGRLLQKRPFRNPHHTITVSAMTGGGNVPQPGEVTLAHNAVLFLDELPEFRREVLEVLRQPLEERHIIINRTHGNYDFPADFLLCCAMNPCPCGYYGDKKRECVCTGGAIERYKRKISGPLLDRIDIKIKVQRVEFRDLTTKTANEESSESIRKRVIAARKIQLQRLKQLNIVCNGQMEHNAVMHFCTINNENRKFLSTVFDSLNLSARSLDKILKISRTIADLAGSKTITQEHLAEAISLNCG